MLLRKVWSFTPCSSSSCLPSLYPTTHAPSRPVTNLSLHLTHLYRRTMSTSHPHLQQKLTLPPLPPLPLFQRLLTHPPGSPAIFSPSQSPSSPTTYTYSQLLYDIAKSRSQWHQRGLKPGERVAFMIPNSYEYVVTLLGVWAAGGIAVPLGTKGGVADVGYVIGDSGARRVVVGEGEGGVEETVKGGVGVVYDKAKRDGVAEAEVGLGKEGGYRGGEIQVEVMRRIIPESTRAEVVIDPEEDPQEWIDKPAMLIYTSGTTSLPKGVLTTHNNLLHQILALYKAWEYVPQDRLLHLLPLHHIHGILPCLLVPLYTGASVEFLYPFSPVRVIDRLISGVRGKITLLMAVPTIYSKLLSHITTSLSSPQEVDLAASSLSSPQEVDLAASSLAALRLAVSGSAALPKLVAKEWNELVLPRPGGQPILERYGMTEVGLVLSCGLDTGKGHRREGTVGWPMEGYEVALLPLEGDGEWETGAPTLIATTSTDGQPQAADGEQILAVGELLIRGPGVFTKYWNRPPSTTEKEFLSADHPIPLSASPSPSPPYPSPPFPQHHFPTHNWFRTGDIAALTSPPPGGTSPPPAPAYKILGRASTDILKSSGYKLSTLEIEHAICSSPFLSTLFSPSEISVVGVPSEVYGDVVGVVVALPPQKIQELAGEGEMEDRKTRKKKAERKLLGFIRQWLTERGTSPYKIPRVCRVVEEELPRNAMGKVVKKGLVGMFTED